MIPITRRQTRDLIERVAAETPVPVAVVWTKDDVQIPEAAQNTIAQSYNEHLPRAHIMKTTTDRPETIVECFVRMLLIADADHDGFDISEPRNSRDPFVVFRGLHVNR